MGEYAAARPLAERALAITETKLGPDHPAIATCLNNLAEILREVGEYAAAAVMLRRALDIFRLRLPHNHPHILGAMLNLAGIELHLARHDAPPSAGDGSS
nr:tetratricopeptide repeat protein [Oscillochloris trichoides]